MLRWIYNLYVTAYNAHVDRHNRKIPDDPEGIERYNYWVDWWNRN